MPQTDGQITSKYATLEVSADQVDTCGAVLNWQDISGSAVSVEPSGGAHMTGSIHSMGPYHRPLQGIGKVEDFELTIRIIYTEEPNEATDLIQGYYENETRVWLRHRPKGALAGAWERCSRGWFTEGPKGPTDADSGDIIAEELPFFGDRWDLGIQGTT